jgi:hypothetical protein
MLFDAVMYGGMAICFSVGVLLALQDRVGMFFLVTLGLFAVLLLAMTLRGANAQYGAGDTMTAITLVSLIIWLPAYWAGFQKSSNHRWRGYRRRLGRAVPAERLGRGGLRPRSAGRAQDRRGDGQRPRRLPALSDVPMPKEGKLTFHGTIGEAVEGAEYVQESVSERIELKHKVYAQLQQANPGVLIGSSTSGFKASDLQKGSPAPENIIVAHPFNPVYLLPLSEVSGSDKNPPDVVEKTVEIMKDIGMFPWSSATRSTPSSATASLRRSGARRCGC